MRTIKTFILSHVGYTIIGRGYAKRHYALTFDEALSWAACYDDGATVYASGYAVAQRNKLGA
jgi:hypothetical protein